VSKRVIAGLLLATTFLGTSGLAYAESTLTIESWRSDDLQMRAEDLQGQAADVHGHADRGAR